MIEKINRLSLITMTAKLDHRELARQMQTATTKGKTPLVKPPADPTLAQLNMQVAQLSDAINAQYIQGGEVSNDIDSLRVSVEKVNAAFQTLNSNAGAMLTTHKGQIEALQSHGTKVTTSLQGQAVAIQQLNKQMEALADLPASVGVIQDDQKHINRWIPYAMLFTVILSVAAPFFLFWAGDFNHQTPKSQPKKAEVSNVRR
jgi:uncharacterized protein (DUF3084 family)